MEALVLGADGPRLVDHPPAERASEARIRVRLAGICATDLELIKGYMGFRGVLGHEWVGIVEDAPDPAWIGRRVVGDINCPCGVCPACLSGRGTHCPSRTVLGILGRDGAFAERLWLPLGNLHMVPEGVPDEQAVFVEPLAAACQILEQVHVRPTARVVVLGSGRLAQLCARVLALVADTSVVARNERTAALLPPHIPVIDEARARGADVVVDCTGSPEGLALASRTVRPRGSVVLKTTTHDLGGASPNAWVIDEITVLGSRCGPFEPALRLLRAGLVDPTPLITCELPLSLGVLALERAADKSSIKVLLRP